MSARFVTGRSQGLAALDSPVQASHPLPNLLTKLRFSKGFGNRGLQACSSLRLACGFGRVTSHDEHRALSLSPPLLRYAGPAACLCRGGSSLAFWRLQGGATPAVQHRQGQ